MTLEQLSPMEHIAISIARDDFHYVSTQILSQPSGVGAEMALIQYGAMAAYETQIFYSRAFGVTLEAAWDPETAKAARMSAKFFADKKLRLDGVVGVFESLLTANRGTFIPSRGWRKLLNFLRDDLSVVTLDGAPYSANISAYYLLGLTPGHIADREGIRDAVFALGQGIGNIAGELLEGADTHQHDADVQNTYAWWDGKSHIAFPRLFGGQIAAPLAAAILTIQGIVASAASSPSREGCSHCTNAARKHRFVALFQSLTALDLLKRESAVPQTLAALMIDADTVWLLKQTKLRNAFVHLGMQDIASNLPPGSTVEDAVEKYTGLQWQDVDERVTSLLGRLNRVLKDWMLTPTPQGRIFLDAMHPAPE